MVGANLVKSCVGELSGLAEKLLEKVPKSEEWSPVRKFLRDTIRLLSKGDVMAGASAFTRILPYVGKALNNIDSYVKVSDAYQITETLTEHFLVDNCTKEDIEKYLAATKLKLLELREVIESFTTELDDLLTKVIAGEEDIGFYKSVQLAFQMNRIAAQIAACENRLAVARKLIDDLDTHVAGKNLLACLLSYVCFIGSIVLGATGNVPASAALLATATATRHSSNNLQEYRKQLAVVDSDHRDLQTELSDWKYRFRAEQRNFLLLAGVKYALLFMICLGLAFVILGKAANFMFFAAITLFLVVKAEKGNNARYYAGMLLAVLAAVMEYQGYSGLVCFNTGAAAMATIQFAGVMDII